MMTKLPSSSTITSNSTLKEFQTRVRVGMKKHFNSYVYEGMIHLTNYSRRSSKVKVEWLQSLFGIEYCEVINFFYIFTFLIKNGGAGF